ncbi:hypothetical protein [Burkholderia cepacia]|uniref:hypothetical protein n=1 Tax=Burkholderia cepacia TaxID=292 RepID=UPI00163AC6BF|nr:hypothetical protein [Burkholderia cepacia]
MAIPLAVDFESGRIISRIRGIRVRMQKMHARGGDLKRLRIITALGTGDLI